jgi:hypothetical protein
VIARVHWAPILVVVATGAVAGCGSTTSVLGGSSVTTRHAQRSQEPALPALPENGAGQAEVPTPGPTGIAPRGGDVAVIRAWSDALRRGDVRAAARYFALPSVMINGTDAGGGALVIPIGTAGEAIEANASLPCGALFLSADQRGRYVNALFRLTGRPGVGGSDCGTGAGQTARTNFVIAGGRIIEWIRAPDDPGDNGTPPAAPTVPTVPTVTVPAGPTV